MHNFVGTLKMAFLLAAALVFITIVPGCSSSSEPEAAEATESFPQSNSAYSSPAEIFDASQSGNRYAVDVEDSDAPSADAIQYLLSLRYIHTSDLRFYWLDSETLTREIAYANALVDAYKEGNCPEKVQNEAEFLAYLKAIIELDDPGSIPGLWFFVTDTNYLWEIVIAELDSVYLQAGELEGLDRVLRDDFTDDVEELVDSYTNEVLYYCSCLGQEQPMIDGVPIPEPNDEPAEIFYAVSALLHEACCEYEHIQNKTEYPFCASLFESYVYGSYYYDCSYEEQKLLTHPYELRGPDWDIKDYVPDFDLEYYIENYVRIFG